MNVTNIDWPLYRHTLSDTGFALLPAVLSSDECQEVAALFDTPTLFRKTIVMQNHGYGRGEYKYFTYPLPPLIDVLRHRLFREFAPVANEWHGKLGISLRYPTDLDEWLKTCHEAGQTRPTPLILTYGPGDWNALHQDMYGALYFPFQAVLFLNEPGQDYAGGEFVMLEQRPRMQSKATVLLPKQGQILLFTTKFRPAKSARGHYRVAMRHGVSEVREGNRVTVGLIFHDAA
ncbi:2OG-Fe(II) oxygenase [Spirosoma radiotolerans]|uniref:Prolyl 4-hydroxylase subunit alpha n=1 Tax=Spirosoma radiotolerans TaxID=1379870 RepID=A0A0E3V6I2_9BACT|nr:2OG-Fe(II) oxygenase [Spirosoma radiotolerans]AKD54561.1 prolyl 4-hydroxylase subunit alpha [Spirosoma radiotolerans]